MTTAADKAFHFAELVSDRIAKLVSEAGKEDCDGSVLLENAKDVKALAEDFISWYEEQS